MEIRCTRWMWVVTGGMLLSPTLKADVPLHGTPGEDGYRSPHGEALREQEALEGRVWPGKASPSERDQAAGSIAAGSRLPGLEQDAPVLETWERIGAEGKPGRDGPRVDPPSSPKSIVYGYWPYWGDDLSTVPYESLTHLAIFAAGLNDDGTLNNTYRWTDNAAYALSLAAPYGVRVHLTVISTDDNVMNTVLASPSLRATTVAEIRELVSSYGAHGVNIDFEGLDSHLKADFVAFIEELRLAVPDVFLATPAVDWSGSYDYDLLAAASDGLFIMGYGYHWSGGNPGPIAPLFGGDPWSAYSLEWTIDDYITWGAPRDKIILGLPLYGYDWPTIDNSVPGTSTGSGSSLTYSAAVPAGLEYGRMWDSVTHTPYAFPDSVSQLWYDDLESLEDKVSWGLDQGLQGVGFWALTYEDGDPAFWQMVDEQSAAAVPCIRTDGDEDGANLCIDCDDADPEVSPLLPELAGDGIDNDCDGEVDETPGGGCEEMSVEGGRYGHFAIVVGGVFGLVLQRRRRRRCSS